MNTETEETRGRKALLDWSLIDWTKRTIDISRETGASTQTVSRNRSRFAPETMHVQREIDWSAVDWSKPTSQIAKELDTRENNVSEHRAKFAPKTLGRSPQEKRRRAQVGKLNRVANREFNALHDDEFPIF